MTDRIHIRLDRTATHWQWTVTNDRFAEDLTWGLDADYTTACAEALAAYDRMVAAERDAP